MGMWAEGYRVEGMGLSAWGELGLEGWSLEVWICSVRDMLS